MSCPDDPGFCCIDLPEPGRPESGAAGFRRPRSANPGLQEVAFRLGVGGRASSERVRPAAPRSLRRTISRARHEPRRPNG